MVVAQYHASQDVGDREGSSFHGYGDVEFTGGGVGPKFQLLALEGFDARVAGGVNPQGEEGGAAGEVDVLAGLVDGVVAGLAAAPANEQVAFVFESAVG